MNAPLVKLGDVCEVVRGITYTKSDEVDVGGLAVLRSTNINLERNTVDLSDLVRIRSEVACDEQKIVHRNTILICLANGSKKHLGKVALITEELGCAFGGFMGLLIPKTATISMPYLFHFLISPSAHKRLVESVEGTNINNLRVETVRNLMLPLPPLAEQERIVAHLEQTLGAIDTMEAKFREMAETAERHFRATLAEAFAALSSAPAAPLGEVCEVFADGDWIETRDQSTSGIRLIQTGNVGEGRFLAKDGRRRYISEGTFHRLHCTEVYPGDILISRLPDPLGRACILKDTGERMITAVDCTIMRPKQVLLPAFFVFYSCTPAYQEAVKKQATGAIRSRISRRALAQIDLPLPSLAEQERVVARLERAEGVSRRVVALAQAGVAQCGVYRRAVLSEAFEGGVGGGGDE